MINESIDKKFYFYIGLLSVAICIITWLFDVTGVVGACIYCRVERTVVGILGILLLLPLIPYITYYLSYFFGFFGAYVASQQIFILLANHTIDTEFATATISLLIIIAQVFLLATRGHD